MWKEKSGDTGYSIWVQYIGEQVSKQVLRYYASTVDMRKLLSIDEMYLFNTDIYLFYVTLLFSIIFIIIIAFLIKALKEKR